ncbi:helix-turn-helix domain-containing protein (plasmid) [Nonomuraea sp. CA-143628]|uniref:helix-turn-helix domain-containing protein n=1 Tax=Nonomuraea sp. CA-143628 TaxID=3239997 RepID=UPI003D8BE627
MMRPDDEDKPFIARWNVFMRILLLDPSVKLVGRTLGDYADFGDGSDCFPSNERLERDTGLGDKTIRNALALLRGLGAAQRVATAVPHRGRADEYQLAIPDHWAGMAVTGPNGHKFTCLWCGSQINPQGGGSLGPDGRPRWHLYKAVFCAPPRKTKGREGSCCNEEWNRARRKAGLKTWGSDNTESWNLFRTARGDDW